MTVLAVLGRGIVDPETPVLHADDLGLSRGDGCFEGCRLVPTEAGPAQPDKLGAHLDRMSASAAALGLPFDRAAWLDLIEQAVARWDRPDEASMKLVLTRGRPGNDQPTGLISISPLSDEVRRQRREGVRVLTLGRGTPADAYEGAPWLLGGVKTLSYAINMAAQREAQARGADDVIFVSSDGAVLEAPTSTVIWTRGRAMLTTPTGGNGILAGTTAARLFERAAAVGWSTGIEAASTDDLHAADGLWLIGSVRGPVEVIELDGKTRPRSPGLDSEIRRLAGF